MNKWKKKRKEKSDETYFICIYKNGNTTQEQEKYFEEQKWKKIKCIRHRERERDDDDEIKLPRYYTIRNKKKLLLN